MKTQNPQDLAALAPLPCSPPSPSFTDRIAQVAYGRTASVDDPKNANADWRSGYAVGFENATESMEAIRQEWEQRGRPNGKGDASFCEWKIGFWAGRFARLDSRVANNAMSHERSELAP